MRGTTDAPLVGPPRVPFVGHLLDFRRDPLGFVRRASRYGDIVPLQLGPERMWLVTHPDHLRHILQENQRNYGKQSVVWEKMAPLLGQGLVTAEGDEWLRQRRIAQPIFHKEKIAGFAATIATAADEMLDGWLPHAVGGAPIDVGSELMRLALHVLGDTILHFDLRAEAVALGAAVTEILERIVLQTRTILVYLPTWVPTPGNRRFRRAVEHLDASVDRAIARCRGSARREGLLAMLMDARDEETGAAMSDALLRDQVKSFLFAGHETTAIALTWALVFLARHPDAARALREEVDRVLGDRAPGVDDLRALAGVRRFISETMRLRPPVWFVGRTALGADRIGGHPIAPGGLLLISPFAVHHRPDLWRDPERFDPDRFLPERASEIAKFAYLPFGGGPRRCIGNDFAMMEMMLVLARIVQRFELNIARATEVTEDAQITLRPKGRVLAQVRRRR